MTESKAKFIVYRTQNLISGKIYIGVHKTYDIDKDPYLGSGKVIKSAIKKYGKKNFNRETLYIFDTAKEAYQKEREIVNKDFLDSKNHYNIRIGGKGGFSYSHEQAVYYGKLSSETNRIKGKEKKEKNIFLYFKNPKKCKYCRAIIPYEKRFNTFCNGSCSAKFNNKNRIDSGWKMSEETKERIRRRKQQYLAKIGYIVPEKVFCQECKKELKKERKSKLCFQCYNKKRSNYLSIEDIKKEREAGKTIAAIAKKHNVSATCISSKLKS